MSNVAQLPLAQPRLVNVASDSSYAGDRAMVQEHGTERVKRPSFQFYPGDWSSDLNLRRCSPAARGVWMDVLCALHNSDDGYGLVRWPLKELVRTIGASPAHVKELVEKGVLRGSDKLIEHPVIFVPRSGRKEGAPVTLIAPQAGPLWYSKRLVRDEYVRTIRGESSRFSADLDEAPKVGKEAAPKPPFGDGSSTSSSSSPSGFLTASPDGLARADESAPRTGTTAKGPDIPDCPHQRILALWRELLPALPQHSEWNETRQGYLRARWKAKAVELGWKSQDDGLKFFAKVFRYIGTSKFLTGRTQSRGDRPPFEATLAWVLRPNNFAKVIEGEYHKEG